MSSWYEPAKPVDLEHSAEHLCVHAGGKDPVDRGASVLRLRRQTCKTCRREQETHETLWSAHPRSPEGHERTLEFAALPDGEDQDNAPSRAERRVQLLLVDRQRGPDPLNTGGDETLRLMSATHRRDQC